MAERREDEVSDVAALLDAAGSGAPSDVLAALARAGDSGGDVEDLAPPLLEALQAATGLESAYLTSIDWSRGVQRIRFARNSGELTIPEGLELPWQDTLCRRALESGQAATADVPSVWGDSQTARDLGIRTYVGVPVLIDGGEIVGTLCGASGERREVADPTVALVRLFARLIGDTIARERRGLTDWHATAAEQQLRERAEFVAIAHHKLKTPTAVIKGWADLLAGVTVPLTEDQSERAVDTIRRNAQTLAVRIDEMLDEARAQVLARELEPEAVELGEFLEELAGDMRARSEAHPIEVDVAGQPRVRVDRSLLRVVLEHLVDNAETYSPDGGTIVLRVGRTDLGRTAIDVIDQGAGLPHDVDIFAPFARGDHEASGGAGLGLHIVQTLVHAAGGEVTASRNPDRGSTFRVVLATVSS